MISGTKRLTYSFFYFYTSLAIANSEVKLIHNIRFYSSPKSETKSFAEHIILKELDRPSTFRKKTNGANPMATYCKENLKGIHAPLKTKKGDVSTCLFKDNSFIYLWDLHKQIIKNRTKPKK